MTGQGYHWTVTSGQLAAARGYFDAAWELFPEWARISSCGDVMKIHFTKLPAKIWALLALPVVAIAYPVATVVVPAVLHAVVPEVVRSVLSLI
jgi:hypothetical protein